MSCAWISTKFCISAIWVERSKVPSFLFPRTGLKSFIKGPTTLQLNRLEDIKRFKAEDDKKKLLIICSWRFNVSSKVWGRKASDEIHVATSQKYVVCM